METKKTQNVRYLPQRFKSYYVVWKPLVAHRKRRNRSRWFKSYYVVWKLLPPSHIHLSPFGGFKSYYVVWKLGVPSPMMYSIFSCLNRTMQYGNSSVSLAPGKVYVFKSYYVVWKLLFLLLLLLSPVRLNRTMQYGNSNINACFQAL